jgi:3-oxoacyl-[acyl-carrier-protein] synthase II
MAREPVVITGLGVLSCVGIGRTAFWDALRRGASGIGSIDRFDASDLPCQIAGQLWDFQPEDFMKKNDVKRWHRHAHQAVACARLAVDDAALDEGNYKPERVAVGFGTSVGSPNEAWNEQYSSYLSHGYKNISRFASTAFSAHSATVNIGIDIGVRGPAITIASGCATGLDTISWGMSQIQSGRADAVIAGATESPIFPVSVASACSLGVLSKRNEAPSKAMRPFDRHRDGIVLSEGAGAVVLERADYAKARGARIFGEVAGYGSAAEARNPLLLESSGETMSRAIDLALADSAMEPHEVDMIHSHGVSLAMYDRAETNAYKRSFGDYAYRIPVSAVKSMIGQSYSAGGILGLAAAILSLEEGVVTPTINLEDPDPECDLDYVPHEERFNDIRSALVSAMSFGGTHSATLIRQAC